MLDGRDLRTWSNPAEFPSRLRGVSARPPRASLALDLKETGSRVEATLTATISHPPDRVDADLYIAITESNLASKVTAGENKGAVLKHDHVVRAWTGPLAVDLQSRSVGNFTATTTVPLGPDWKRRDLSIVAVAQNSRNGEVLQALVSPLCRD